MEPEKRICPSCQKEKLVLIDFPWDKTKKVCKTCQSKKQRDNFRKAFGHFTDKGYRFGRTGRYKTISQE